MSCLAPYRHERAVVLVTVKAKPSVAAEDAASLDRHCARRRKGAAAGTEEGLRRGRTKEDDEGRQAGFAGPSVDEATEQRVEATTSITGNIIE